MLILFWRKSFFLVVLGIGCSVLFIWSVLVVGVRVLELLVCAFFEFVCVLWIVWDACLLLGIFFGMR